LRRIADRSHAAPANDLLNAHINTFGTGPGGRLFVSERNKDELPVGTIHRIWR
jgi:hypothetical protein